MRRSRATMESQNPADRESDEPQIFRRPEESQPSRSSEPPRIPVSENHPGPPVQPHWDINSTYQPPTFEDAPLYPGHPSPQSEPNQEPQEGQESPFQNIGGITGFWPRTSISFSITENLQGQLASFQASIVHEQRNLENRARLPHPSPEPNQSIFAGASELEPIPSSPMSSVPEFRFLNYSHICQCCAKQAREPEHVEMYNSNISEFDEAFFCYGCDSRFNNRNDLRDHHYETNNCDNYKEIILPTAKTFECLYCRKSYKTFERLLEHLNTAKHKTKVSKVFIDIRGIDQSQIYTTTGWEAPESHRIWGKISSITMSLAEPKAVIIKVLGRYCNLIKVSKINACFNLNRFNILEDEDFFEEAAFGYVENQDRDSNSGSSLDSYKHSSFWPPASPNSTIETSDESTGESDNSELNDILSECCFCKNNFPITALLKYVRLDSIPD